MGVCFVAPKDRGEVIGKGVGIKGKVVGGRLAVEGVPASPLLSSRLSPISPFPLSLYVYTFS